MPDVPEFPHRTAKPRKKHRAVQVWYRSNKIMKFGWCRFGRYESHEIARSVVADQKRKYPDFWEFAIGAKPE